MWNTRGKGSLCLDGYAFHQQQRNKQCSVLIPEPLHPVNPFPLTDTKDTNTPPSRSAHSNQPAMSTSLRAISQGPVRHTLRLSISNALHSLRDRAVRYRDHLVTTSYIHPHTSNFPDRDRLIDIDPHFPTPQTRPVAWSQQQPPRS
jgi:hypothetical protein